MKNFLKTFPWKKVLIVLAIGGATFVAYLILKQIAAVLRGASTIADAPANLVKSLGDEAGKAWDAVTGLFTGKSDSQTVDTSAPVNVGGVFIPGTDVFANSPFGAGTFE